MTLRDIIYSVICSLAYVHSKTDEVNDKISHVFILVRKLHPLSHLLALFFSFSPTYTKNKALKTEVYSEKATPINCYPPIATSNVLGPSGLLLSSLLTWLILAILYCNRLRLRVKRKINWNWIELNLQSISYHAKMRNSLAAMLQGYAHSPRAQLVLFFFIRSWTALSDQNLIMKWNERDLL